MGECLNAMAMNKSSFPKSATVPRVMRMMGLAISKQLPEVAGLCNSWHIHFNAVLSVSN